MANTDKRPSEFGGRPGLVQATDDGHVPRPEEIRMGITQTNAADPESDGQWGNGDRA